MSITTTSALPVCVSDDEDPLEPVVEESFFLGLKIEFDLWKVGLPCQS